MSKIYTVLVLDANQRSALAVTRALAPIHDIKVFTTDSSKRALAGESRFSEKFFECPSSSTKPREFLNWLKKIINKYSIDLLMPVTEITSQLILMFKEDFPDVKLPFLSYEQLIQVADKSNLAKLAIEQEILIPKSYFYNSSKELKLEELSYPCVIKPSQSQYFEQDEWVSTCVRVIESKEELERTIINDIYLANHDFMIQEFIPGHGAGIFCYYDKGEAKVFFAHNRLREKPPSGGVSVLSESIDVDDTLKQAAQKVLESVKWHGVAMVEFRVTPDNKAYLMEVNTRFWGSLQLAIDSGVNFPHWVCATELGLEPPMSEDYKKGQRLRWLLGDFDSLYLYIRSPKYSVSEKISRLLQFTFGNIFRCKHEVNRFYDLKPAFYEFREYISNIRR